MVGLLFQDLRGHGTKQQQIPFGNDRQKNKGNSKSRSRFPPGMTDRKARATAKATADSLRE
jgi:hypothetical protein